jgi:hypothetical protein
VKRGILTAVLVAGAGSAAVGAGIVLEVPGLAGLGGLVTAGGVVAIFVASARTASMSAEDSAAPTNDELPSLARVRRRFYGARTPFSDTASSALVASARMRPGSLAPAPGPFDARPDEAVYLDPAELPWELREDEPKPL